MSRELDKLRHAMMEAPKQEVANPAVPLSSPASFFTFRYSCTEISSQGGNLSVKMRETRYQDGKLVSEECEGTLDRKAYDTVIIEAQQQFMNQVGSLMKLFFLPFSGRDGR